MYHAEVCPEVPAAHSAMLPELLSSVGVLLRSLKRNDMPGKRFDAPYGSVSSKRDWKRWMVMTVSNIEPVMAKFNWPVIKPGDSS